MNLKPEELVREAMRANPDVGDSDDTKGGLRMERLTFAGNFCEIAQCACMKCPYDTNCSQKQVWERLKAYEDTKRTPKEVTALGELFDYALKESKTLGEQLTLLKHIRELAEADKDGRVVVLPCKVWDTVWRIVRDGEPHITRDEVRDMYFADDMTLCVELVGERVTFTEKFGKTVFLSREEAEKALQEMEGKKDGNETNM